MGYRDYIKAGTSTVRHLLRSSRGSGLAEYMTLTGAMAVAVIASVSILGDQVSLGYSENAYDIKEPQLLRTGYVSPFKDEKVFGIAESYRGKVTFLFEEAGFKSAIGLYKFTEDGTITDVQIIFANASREGAGGSLVPGESAVDVALESRDQIGFFIASNGYSKNNKRFLTAGRYELLDEEGRPATIYSEDLLTLWNIDETTGKRTAIRTQYAHNLFYSHANPDRNYEPNFDNYPHTVGFVHKRDGVVTLGFEDLSNGGDHDYNDLILEFDIGRSNAAVLDPNLDYDYDGYDDWVNKLRLSETDRIKVTPNW